MEKICAIMIFRLTLKAAGGKAMTAGAVTWYRTR